jgi:hypothetical protein
MAYVNGLEAADDDREAEGLGNWESPKARAGAVYPRRAKNLR